MPFTPFHIGPSALLALSFPKKLDIPVFLLANIVIDVESLLIGLYWPWYWSAHPYFHSLLIGSLFGYVLGIIAYLGKGLLKKLMRFLHLEYRTSLKKVLLSAILGIWFHILMDALVDPNIKPFFPFSRINPFLGLISVTTARWIYSLCFIPAIALYIYNRNKSTFWD